MGATVYATAKDHKTIEGIMEIKAGKLRGYDSYLKEFGSNLLNTLMTKYSNNKEMRIYINGKIFN